MPVGKLVRGKKKFSRRAAKNARKGNILKANKTFALFAALREY